MAKGCALSTGYLPRGGLPRNSVDRITDRPDMTSAVDRGRKASTQTNKKRVRIMEGSDSLPIISLPVLLTVPGRHLCCLCVYVACYWCLFQCRLFSPYVSVVNFYFGIDS